MFQCENIKAVNSNSLNLLLEISWHCSKTFPASSHINMIKYILLQSWKKPMRVNNICRLSLLQHRATATLKSMNAHTFFCYTHYTNSSFITQGRMSVFCKEEASPSTPYADIQPWQVYSKRRIKPYTEPHMSKIPRIIYRHTDIRTHEYRGYR